MNLDSKIEINCTVKELIDIHNDLNSRIKAFTNEICRAAEIKIDDRHMWYTVAKQRNFNY